MPPHSQTPVAILSADPLDAPVGDLAGVPIAAVNGRASAQAKSALARVEFPAHGRAVAEHLHPPDHGVTGKGHGLIYESDSDHALRPVPEWMAAHVARPAARPAAGAEAARTGRASDPA